MTEIQEIHREEWKGRAGPEHKVLFRLGSHLLRIRRHLDDFTSYQSWIKLSRWDGNEWQELDFIPAALMSSASAVDIEELTRRAKLLLEV